MANNTIIIIIIIVNANTYTEFSLATISTFSFIYIINTTD